MASSRQKNYSNFLLIIIIVSLALFVLLCPRKQPQKKSSSYIQPLENFGYYSNEYQEIPFYLPPEVADVSPTIVNGDEYTKAMNIQSMNMDYDTRGDMNDLININQLPGQGSMFVYP